MRRRASVGSAAQLRPHDHTIWFGDGPYKSKADAKLARSTIRVCPAPTPEEEKAEDSSG